MKAHTLLTKAATGLGTVAMALALTACSHHSATAGQDYGNIRTEQTAQQNTSSDQAIAAAPAPANTQGTTGTTSTPAIISGPAQDDESGRLYTSSSVGAAGNASGTGLNTNVNIIPKQNNGTVVVAETPAPTPLVTETVVETPAPAPVVVETPAPAPPVIVEETPAPMTSSTTETKTTTTHRRLRKD
jgi:hypothetical protein